MSTGELTKKIAFAGKASTIIPNSHKVLVGADGVSKLLQVQTEMGGLVVEATTIEAMYELLHSNVGTGSRSLVHGWEIKWTGSWSTNTAIMQPENRFSYSVHSIGYVILNNDVYLVVEIVGSAGAGELYFANLMNFLLAGGSISPATFYRTGRSIGGWLRSGNVSGINRVAQLDSIPEVERETLIDGMWCASRSIRAALPPEVQLLMVVPRTLNQNRTGRTPSAPQLHMVGEVPELVIGNIGTGDNRTTRVSVPV